MIAIKLNDRPGAKLLTEWLHEMAPVVPATSSLRPKLSCLHFLDQHTGVGTNTWDWVNSLHTEAHSQLLKLLDTTNVDEAVQEIDRRAQRANIPVEYLIDTLLEAFV
jgi:hypothetical protein